MHVIFACFLLIEPCVKLHAVILSSHVGAVSRGCSISINNLPFNVKSCSFSIAADMSYSSAEATIFFSSLQRVCLCLFNLSSTLSMSRVKSLRK